MTTSEARLREIDGLVRAAAGSGPVPAAVPGVGDPELREYERWRELAENDEFIGRHAESLGGEAEAGDGPGAEGPPPARTRCRACAYVYEYRVDGPAGGAGRCPACGRARRAEGG